MEKDHWRKVLYRIIAVVRYLAETNSAFRGRSNVPFDKHNGNFLKLIEMIGTFDDPMKEHLRRIRDEETRVHYLGSDIQNELIGLLGEATKNKILDEVRIAKYYSVILDCTPDKSHKEQISFSIRYVNITKDPPEIVERFVEFLDITDSTGEGITEVLKILLKKNGLDIMN
ncbi:uncharacterized protein LOC116160227 [Photinus pyralis]|nr:uncharacterized protein LOC116160227 [Photinus pyralis]